MGKKILCLLFSAVMCVSVAACGAGSWGGNEALSSGQGGSASETHGVSDFVTDGFTDGSVPLFSSSLTDSSVSASSTEPVDTDLSDGIFSSEDEEEWEDGPIHSTDSSHVPDQGLGPNDRPKPSGNSTGTSGVTSGSDSSQPQSDGMELAGPYDKNIDHKFFATDVRNHSILIYDLDKCNGKYTSLANDSCIIWEWKPKADKTCKLSNIATTPTAAKLRYSPVYGRDVVVACFTGGWAGIIDYQTRTVLFEVSVITNPHDVELLPNGDLVVAGTGGSMDGSLRYFPLSAEAQTYSHELSTTHGHGVFWDPDNEFLWILEDRRLLAVEIENYGTANARMKNVEGISISFASWDGSGHAMAPMFGYPGYYWFSGTWGTWVFNSNDRTVFYPKAYPSSYTVRGVKGLAWFSDGAMIQSVAELGDTSYDWSSNGFRLITVRVTVLSSGEKVYTHTVTEVLTPSREFYKLFPVNKEYKS